MVEEGVPSRANSMCKHPEVESQSCTRELESAIWAQWATAQRGNRKERLQGKVLILSVLSQPPVKVGNRKRYWK